MPEAQHFKPVKELLAEKTIHTCHQSVCPRPVLLLITTLGNGSLDMTRPIQGRIYKSRRNVALDGLGSALDIEVLIERTVDLTDVKAQLPGHDIETGQRKHMMVHCDVNEPRSVSALREITEVVGKGGVKNSNEVANFPFE